MLIKGKAFKLAISIIVICPNQKVTTLIKPLLPLSLTSVLDVGTNGYHEWN